MLSQLSFLEIEAILIHELYHLKKLDHVINLIQRLLEIIFFFNQALWMLSGIIRSEREKRCDDLVISVNTRVLDYVRALYALSMQMNTTGLSANAATGNGEGELRKRIECILKPNSMKTNYREKINALLLFTCGILLVFLVSGFTSGFSITHHNGKPIEIQSDMEPPESPSYPGPGEIAFPDVFLKHPTQTENPEDLIQVVLPLIPSIPDTLTEQEKVRIRNEVREAIEKARLDIMEEIDWEQMKIEMSDIRVQIDSMLSDFDFDLDKDVDVHVDSDVDSIR